MLLIGHPTIFLLKKKIAKLLWTFNSNNWFSNPIDEFFAWLPKLFQNICFSIHLTTDV